jgi:hypothetical protein
MKHIHTFEQFINESRVTWGEELVYDLNRDKATLFVTEYEGLSNDIFFTKDNQAIVTKRMSNIISHGKNPKDLKLDNIKFVYCGIEKEFYSTDDYTKLLNAIYRGLNIRNIKPLKVNESFNEAKELDLKLSTNEYPSGTVARFRIESDSINLRKVINLSRDSWSKTARTFTDNEIGFESAGDRKAAMAAIQKTFDSGKNDYREFLAESTVNEATLKDNSYQAVLFGKLKSGKWSIIKSTDPETRLQTKDDLYPRGSNPKYTEYCIISGLGGNRGQSLQSDAEAHLAQLISGAINRDTAREQFSKVEFI